MPISLTPILLQTRYEFIRHQDSTTVIVGVSLVLGLVVILTVAALMGGNRRGRAARRAVRFSRRAFRRAAAAHGLSRAHLEVLEDLVRAARVRQPMLLFSSGAFLDDTLKKGIYSAHASQELSEEQRQRRITLILQIKQLIEKNMRREGGVRSTTLLRPGQELTLTLPDGRRVATKVTHNLRRMLACAIPAGFDRNRWRKGTHVQAVLWRHGDSGYLFGSKILAFDSIGGRPVFLLQHSRTLKRSQRRSNRRRELGRNCFFFPVLLLESGRGRGAKREAVVQHSFRHLGILEDVSAGGCAISSQTPLGSGKLLRVDFELGNRHMIVAYGKVQRVSATAQARRGVMHVMFTRVSTRHLTDILSYVYDYEEARRGPRRGLRLSASG